MPEADRAGFAERWMADPELYEQLRIAESDLLDDYARGVLSPERRAQVEACLLQSEPQRQKLEFARALHAAVGTRARRRVPWALLAAAGFAAAFMGAAFWFGEMNRNLRTEAAKLRQHAQPRPVATIYAVPMASDGLRGAGREPTLRVPDGAEVVRFVLELDPGDERSSRSAVATSAGRTVWRGEPIQPERRDSVFVAPVWIPASALASGSYEIQLDAAGSAIGYYRFTVAPKQP